MIPLLLQSSRRRPPAVTFLGYMKSLSFAAGWRMSSTADATGNGHTLSLVGAPSQSTTGLVANDSDTATTLNGSSQYCTFANAADLQFAGGDTFSSVAVLKPSSVTGFCEFLQRGRSNFNAQCNFAQRCTNGAFEFYYASAGGVFNVWTSSSSAIFAGGAVTRIAATWPVGSSAPTVYANGSAIAGSVTSGSFANAPLVNTDVGMIGGEELAPKWTGVVDEVWIGRFAITAAQVAIIDKLITG